MNPSITSYSDFYFFLLSNFGCAVLLLFFSLLTFFPLPLGTEPNPPVPLRICHLPLHSLLPSLISRIVCILFPFVFCGSSLTLEIHKRRCPLKGSRWFPAVLYCFFLFFSLLLLCLCLYLFVCSLDDSRVCMCLLLYSCAVGWINT